MSTCSRWPRIILSWIKTATTRSCASTLQHTDNKTTDGVWAMPPALVHLCKVMTDSRLSSKSTQLCFRDQHKRPLPILATHNYRYSHPTTPAMARYRHHHRRTGTCQILIIERCQSEWDMAVRLFDHIMTWLEEVTESGRRMPDLRFLLSVIWRISTISSASPPMRLKSKSSSNKSDYWEIDKQRKYLHPADDHLTLTLRLVLTQDNARSSTQSDSRMRRSITLLRSMTLKKNLPTWSLPKTSGWERSSNMNNLLPAFRWRKRRWFELIRLRAVIFARRSAFSQTMFIVLRPTFQLGKHPQASITITRISTLLPWTVLGIISPSSMILLNLKSRSRARRCQLRRLPVCFWMSQRNLLRKDCYLCSCLSGRLWRLKVHHQVSQRFLRMCAQHQPLCFRISSRTLVSHNPPRVSQTLLPHCLRHLHIHGLIVRWIWCRVMAFQTSCPPHLVISATLSHIQPMHRITIKSFRFLYPNTTDSHPTTSCNMLHQYRQPLKEGGTWVKPWQLCVATARNLPLKCTQDRYYGTKSQARSSATSLEWLKSAMPRITAPLLLRATKLFTIATLLSVFGTIYIFLCSHTTTTRTRNSCASTYFFLVHFFASLAFSIWDYSVA